MYAIVGLGNPGKAYEDTFHNAGFWALDILSKDLGVSFKKSITINALYAIASVGDKRVLLVKPLTFMNLSGKAVAACVNFYKIAIENMIVIRDDIDMELGKIKIKKNSSSGGHKGIDSIIEAIGSKAFIQIKIGVGKNGDAANFVLKHLNENEKKILSACAKAASAASLKIILEGFEKAANQYNNLNVKSEFANVIETIKN